MKYKKLLKKIAEAIFQSSWYPNKKIILESIPDLSSQTYPVFQYMLEQHLNDEYKLIWWVTDKEKYKDVKIKNVVFRNYSPKSALEKMQRAYELCTSRAMLYATRSIGKVFDKQLYVYLKHGTCIKSRLKHCRKDDRNESDLCISISDYFNPIDERELHISQDRLRATGYPRNDYLYDQMDASSIIPMAKDKKIILWMPTFRQAKNSERVDSSFAYPYGLPCLYSMDDCLKLNNALEAKNALLIIKPHPAQDTSFIADFHLSNFVVLSDEEIAEKGYQLYQFVGNTDALITDYSSIYYDYLLTHKNVGITIDDFETYKRETGFAFENVLDVVVGDYISNVDDMVKFIGDVAKGIDRKSKERERICGMVHKYQDHHSTERVYNMIMDELGKRYGK